MQTNLESLKFYKKILLNFRLKDMNPRQEKVCFISPCQNLELVPGLGHSIWLLFWRYVNKAKYMHLHFQNSSRNKLLQRCWWYRLELLKALHLNSLTYQEQFFLYIFLTKKHTLKITGCIVDGQANTEVRTTRISLSKCWQVRTQTFYSQGLPLLTSVSWNNQDRHAFLLVERET